MKFYNNKTENTSGIIQIFYMRVNDHINSFILMLTVTPLNVACIYFNVFVCSSKGDTTEYDTNSILICQ